MWKAAILILILVLLILFTMQNMHQTRINFPFAGSLEIRTVFLLLLCFFLGYIVSSLIWLTGQIKKK